MIKGLYTVASGMMLQMSRQDVVANNIANVNTSGFKKDSAICQAFPQMLISRMNDQGSRAGVKTSSNEPVPIGYLGTGAGIAAVVSDNSLGNTRTTEKSTDLAISSQGYFALTTPQGQRFTRDGSFVIQSDGTLVNAQGYPILDTDDQTIQIEGDFVVDKAGSITVNGQFLAQLKVVDFANPQSLQKEGGVINNMGQEATQVENPGIMQGYLELSNVNAVKEMVSLISTVRAYESCQKVIQAEDDTLQIAINSVGSVA